MFVAASSFNSSRRVPAPLTLTAYQWYIDELRSMDDHSRHYYELKSLCVDNNESSSIVLYSRYKFSAEQHRGFSFLWWKETAHEHRRQFSVKSGKNAIPGFPHMLGLLLHGPPGTLCLPNPQRFIFWFWCWQYPSDAYLYYIDMTDLFFRTDTT